MRFDYRVGPSPFLSTIGVTHRIFKITDGIVRSSNGTTTRNRDHASQATNNTIR